MKSKCIIFIVLVSIIIAIIGCSYGPVFILPEKIKKINIPTMSNKTVYYGMEDKLTNMVIEEFLQDGRLEVTNKKEADAILEGEVTSYTLQSLSLDEENRVKECELEIQVYLVLKDLATSQNLWERTFRQFTRYFPLQEENAEEEAKITVLRYLASDIVRGIVGRR